MPGIFIGQVVTPQRVPVLERSWNGFHSGINHPASAVENVPLGEITPITLFLPERRNRAPSVHLTEHLTQCPASGSDEAMGRPPKFGQVIK